MTVRLIILSILSLSQTACFITYGHREREVSVYDTKTKTPASNLNIAYSHAIPGFYIPRPPDPVTGQLNDHGKTTLILPTVTGGIRVGDDSITLIDSQGIKNGGTFTMHGFPTLGDTLDGLSTPPSRWTLEIRKPEQGGGGQPATRPELR